MDPKKRLLLQRYQADIIKDLDVTYILDDLFTKNAISIDDFQHMFKLQSRLDRANYLIQTLQNGDNNAYEAFVDSLSKDYNWLWQKLVVDNNTTMLNESFEDSLSRGEVPRLPDVFVRRDAVEQQVEAALRQLKRHHFLVLHGMSGSGKTTIAVSVLRGNPDLITSDFGNCVFWLNLANCKTEDDIVAQQNKLYNKASSALTDSSHMTFSVSMSSIGSNADSRSQSMYDFTTEESRDRLKSLFLKPALKDALLVLDEANDRHCLEALDIGCKILVTTRDTDVVAFANPQIIKVENTLTVDESLSLFASSLDVPVSKLPRYPRLLHDACKGSPFLIVLLAAQLAENRERLFHDNRLWKYYLNKLQKKEFLFVNTQHDNHIKTIEVCINSLPSNIASLFKMLAILPDNAKVSAKVLSKLWNKDTTEVEIIMKQLRSKSLIMESYDRNQKNYIYELHDLLMNYLRKNMSEDESKKLHNQFLKSYNYNTDNAPIDIVDDGYIAFYIGYHLLNTKNLNNKWSLFNKLFLNLKFLGNKVRLTGPADVMLDLQKYDHYIVEDNQLNKDLLTSIKSYLSTHGSDLYRYPYTDIVQSILQNESKGILYAKACEIAQKNCANNELYFEFLHEQNVEEIKHSTIDVKESIRSVCFLGDYALVGTSAGNIKFFHTLTNKLKKQLPCLKSPVTWLGACPVNPPMVAALTYDGHVTVWYIDHVDDDDKDEDVIEEESEESFNNNYPSKVTIAPKLGMILNCRWMNNEETLITHTANKIILYSPDGKPQKTIDNFENSTIRCCIPCNNDYYLIAALSNSDNKSIDIVDLITKERVMSTKETDFVANLLTVPGTNKILSLKNNTISEHEFIIKKMHQNIQNNFMTCKTVISSEDIKDNLTFVAMAVNKPGTLLFVSTNDGRVICVDLKNNTRIFDIENRRGNVIAMDLSEIPVQVDEFVPGLDVLLTGTGTMENSAKVWYLDPSYISQATQKDGKARLTQKFDVSFVHSLSPISPINDGFQTASNTPQRHQSFAMRVQTEPKPIAKKTKSLDRHSLKPLNLKGCNGNPEGGLQPLLAVIDDKSHIQVMRGRKMLTEIQPQTEEMITAVKISPCNQYIVYGLYSGTVKKYSLRTKETKIIIDVYSEVQYLNFVTSELLIVAGKNQCLMAYHVNNTGEWKSEMLQRGDSHLGSQEILNDLQGVKKMNGTEKLTSAGSDVSISSRLFSNGIGDANGRTKELRKGSCILDCFWLEGVGLLTVESSGCVKLWERAPALSSVLLGRQGDARLAACALRRRTLALCGGRQFQTFEIREDPKIDVHQTKMCKLSNEIISCALTSDGLMLALGLDSGDVILWNVPGKRQFMLLKHHKSKVQYCGFSPVPDRLFRSAVHSPTGQPSGDDDLPLVLMTMASEIVWWNVSYMMQNRSNKSYWRAGWNAVTPLASPHEPRTELTAQLSTLTLTQHNYFFGNGTPAADCWKSLWRKKTYKEGSKRKDILACIKLSGINAKRLVHDDKFSCFVTIDDPGHVHIMNVMKPNT